MDLEAYEERAHEGPCFVCAFMAGDPAYRHETVYEDEDMWPSSIVRPLPSRAARLRGAHRGAVSSNASACCGC
jgi:hypothetical protein